MSVSTSSNPTRIRWSIAVIILVIAVALQSYFWWIYQEDSTFANFSVLWVWPATLFLLGIWWTFFSGFTWAIRGAGWGLAISGMVAFLSVVAIDGSDGDMVPKFRWRWTPSEAQKAAKFLEQQTIPTVEAPAAEAVVEPLVATEDDWPDFRGAQRDGIIRGRGFRTNWNEVPPKEVWRHPVGLGWSSFAVLGDYVITQEQRGDDESIVCYSLATGEPIWLHGDRVRFSAVEVNGGDGPHATPVIVGELTYALGATGLFNCVKTRTGEAVWQHNVLVDAGEPGTPAKNIEWGLSGAPLVVNDLVIVIAGGTAGRSVIAYDAATGEQRWAAGKFPASYGGPRVETLGGVTQVLAYHGLGLSSHDLATGKQLWSFDWENMPKVNAAQPIRLDDQSLLIGTGYGLGSTRLELKVDGENWTVTQGWKTNKLKLKFNDAVLKDGFVYGLDDGILTCLDVATGKPKWKGGRYGYGQLLLFESTLLILTEQGEIVLVAAQPTGYDEQARIPSLEGTTWNHPAVAHGRLLVRNGTQAACYDVSP